MIVFKEFTFEAAHSLPHLPSGHKCARLHGHSYHVRIEVKGPIDSDTGWVIDYADITGAWKEMVFDKLDHRNLNDVMGTEQTTSERLAAWIWHRMKPAIPWLHSVEVRETATAGAVYRGT